MLMGLTTQLVSGVGPNHANHNESNENPKRFSHLAKTRLSEDVRSGRPASCSSAADEHMNEHATASQRCLAWSRSRRARFKADTCTGGADVCAISGKLKQVETCQAALAWYDKRPLQAILAQAALLLTLARSHEGWNLRKLLSQYDMLRLCDGS